MSKGKKKIKFPDVTCIVCRSKVDMNFSNPNHCFECKKAGNYVRFFAYSGILEIILNNQRKVYEGFSKS